MTRDLPPHFKGTAGWSDQVHPFFDLKCVVHIQPKPFGSEDVIILLVHAARQASENTMCGAQNFSNTPLGTNAISHKSC